MSNPNRYVNPFSIKFSSFLLVLVLLQHLQQGSQSEELVRKMIILYLQSTDFPRKQRQMILLLECRVQIFYLKAEDNPYPSERVRVLNFTVQTQQNTVLNFITETGFQCPGIRNPEITRVYNRLQRSAADRQGIRNPEITRVYNNHNDVSNVMCGIRYLEITMVFFCCYPKYG